LLLDIVNQSINEFQWDCLTFNEQHYPTVHNQGMSDHHLASAFTRRLLRTFITRGYNEAYSMAVHVDRTKMGTSHYQVSCGLGTVWLLSHNMGNAGTASREKLINHVVSWHQSSSTSVKTNDVLLIVADHWLNRSLHSRQLLPWWLGQLPEPLDQYLAQGIKLSACATSLNDSIQQRLGITPHLLKCTHPLVNTQTVQTIRKYAQLYCVIPFHS
jgi:hypothetical protein